MGTFSDSIIYGRLDVNGVLSVVDRLEVSSSAQFGGNVTAPNFLGTATRVSNSAVITLNGGTTEGTNKITFNGEHAKTLNITANSIGAPTLTGTGASGTWGISISGNAATATTASKVSTSVPVDTVYGLVNATMATNDYFRIAVGGATNAGYGEIATGDDANEPIYVRQYSGFFSSIVRSATLLDGSGNTLFPGVVTSKGFVNSDSSNSYVLLGGGGTKAFTSAATPSTIMERDSAGDVNCRLVRSNFDNQSTMSGGLVFRVNNSSDNYFRICSSPAAIREWLGVNDTNHSHDMLFVRDFRTVKPNSTGISSGIQGFKPFFTSTSTLGISNYGDYADLLVLDTYGDSSGGNPNAIAFMKNTSNCEMFIGTSAFNGSSWGTFNRVWHNGISGTTAYDWSAKSLTLAGGITGATSINNSGSLDINSTGDIRLRAGAKSLILNATYLKPYDVDTNTISLGSSGGRWSTVYSKHINIDGDISGVNHLRLNTNAVISGAAHNLYFGGLNNYAHTSYFFRPHWGSAGVTESTLQLQSANISGNMTTRVYMRASEGDSYIQTNRFISTVGNGTAPFSVSSSTLVSSLNADLLDDLHVHTGRNNEANKIVRTDSNGYIQAGYINSSAGNENNNVSPDRVWGTGASDGYMRTYRTSALDVGYVGGWNNTTLRRNLGASNYTTFHVGGASNTYYPVRIGRLDDKYAFMPFSISRYYAETAPNDWNNTTHKGGLSLTMLWNSSNYWDGNGQTYYVESLSETYCTMVSEIDICTGGLIIWLRGGGADYHIHSMRGREVDVSVYLSAYTDAANRTFSPRTDTPRSNFNSRFPVRGASLYDNNHRVYSANNTNIGGGATNYAAGNHTHTGLSSNGWGGITSRTAHGYIDLGPADSTNAHIYTDRTNFYFNKNLLINGNIVWNAANLAFGNGESNMSRGNHTHTFASLTSKPTTLSGYGITDAASSGHAHDLGSNSLALTLPDSSSSSTTFRTTIFGDAAYNHRFRVVRWNAAPSMYGGMGMYGTSINWAGGDTHGFMAIDYNSRNVRVGAGSGNALSWTDRVVLFGQNIGGGATNYAAGNHGHNYLPLSGGTLTGVLTSNSDIRTSGNVFAGKNYGDTPTIHLAVGDTDTGLKWNSDGNISAYANNTSIFTWTTAGITTGKDITLNGDVSIKQNQNSTSNYTTGMAWMHGGATLRGQIGAHNTGGDGSGSITILPYATSTDPWVGSVGLFIAKNTLKIDNSVVWHSTNAGSTSYDWSAKSLRVGEVITVNKNYGSLLISNDSEFMDLLGINDTSGAGGVYIGKKNYWIRTGNATEQPKVMRNGAAYTIWHAGNFNPQGPLTLYGTASSGAAAMGLYNPEYNNIILKGNTSNGMSGIFFQSCKGDTNINHTTDYAFIQYQPYGPTALSGESNRLVIGVANDPNTDKIVLQVPGANDLVINYQNAGSGVAMTEYQIWHAGNLAFGGGESNMSRGNHTHTFASLTSKPTTLAGYGITDAAASGHTHAYSPYVSSSITIGGDGSTFYCVAIQMNASLTSEFHIYKHVHNPADWDGWFYATYKLKNREWGGSNEIFECLYHNYTTKSFLAAARTTSNNGTYGLFWLRGGNRTYHFRHVGATSLPTLYLNGGTLENININPITTGDVPLVTHFWNNGNLAFGSGETNMSRGNHTHTFASLTSKPTTLGGYGITDAAASGHTHSYLPINGGILTGALSFANVTWNPMGDDAAIGDSNVAGMICIKSLNSAIPGIAFYNNSGTQIGQLKSNNGTLQWGTTNVSLSGHVHNMNEISDAPAVAIASGTVTRKIFMCTNKTGEGYISRAAIGLTNPRIAFSPVILSVGLNDAGTSWRDYTFDTNGNLSIDSVLYSSGTHSTSNGKFISIRCENSSHCHYNTDATQSHYFNKQVEVNGNIKVYGYNTYLSPTGVHKHDSNNSYMLLGGGGHKLLSDFWEKTALNTTSIDFSCRNLTVAGSISQTSSEKFKTNIINYTDSALDLIERVNVVKFHYKNNLEDCRIGFIAENTPEELSTKNKNIMDIGSNVGVLLKAVQELNKKCNTYEQFITKMVTGSENHNSKDTTIKMCDKNMIPEGWVICDGSNNTLDLSKSFIGDTVFIVKL